MPYAELVNCWAVNMHIGSSWTVNLANLRGEYIAGEFRTKGAPIYGGPTVDALGRVATGRTFPTIVSCFTFFKIIIYPLFSFLKRVL